jgi:hypothetical protein
MRRHELYDLRKEHYKKMRETMIKEWQNVFDYLLSIQGDLVENIKASLKQRVLYVPVGMPRTDKTIGRAIVLFQNIPAPFQPKEILDPCTYNLFILIKGQDVASYCMHKLMSNNASIVHKFITKYVANATILLDNLRTAFPDADSIVWQIENNGIGFVVTYNFRKEEDENLHHYTIQLNLVHDSNPNPQIEKYKYEPEKNIPIQ